MPVTQLKDITPDPKPQSCHNRRSGTPHTVFLFLFPHFESPVLCHGSGSTSARVTDRLRGAGSVPQTSESTSELRDPLTSTSMSSNTKRKTYGISLSRFFFPPCFPSHIAGGGGEKSGVRFRVSVDRSPCLYDVSDSLCHFLKNSDCRELSAISAAVNWNLALGDFFLQQFLSFWKKRHTEGEIKLFFFFPHDPGNGFLLTSVLYEKV